MEYKLENLEKDYELELDRIVAEIEKSDVKKVLLQLPDGLKPWGLVLTDYISEKTGVDVMIWLGDCFGACDLPDSEGDLVIQFGHSEW
jgi:2-(3-amino-3-carboxypropyl)histidine synthase|tara:strand:+ start:414 stop:677 length:264 start_codon:yes stop_codon:yes gene_type:complete